MNIDKGSTTKDSKPRLFEMLKFGKNVDKTCMELLKLSTWKDNLFIVCATVKPYLLSNF